MVVFAMHKCSYAVLCRAALGARATLAPLLSSSLSSLSPALLLLLLCGGLVWVVRLHVRAEVVAAGEPTAALLALIRPRPRVRAHVPLQLVRPGKGPLASGMLACMRALARV